MPVGPTTFLSDFSSAMPLSLTTVIAVRYYRAGRNVPKLERYLMIVVLVLLATSELNLMVL